MSINLQNNSPLSDLIDIGVNLSSNRYKATDSADDILNRAGAVSCVVATSVDKPSYIFNSNFCTKWNLPVNGERKPRLYYTAGVHPHWAKHYDSKWFESIVNLNDSNLIFWGEMGLDYDRMLSSKEEQVKAFVSQLQIAQRNPKPLFLHERDAMADFIDILKKENKNCPAIVHCFTGNTKAMQAYLELDCYIGITGWICDDRRNQDLVQAIKELPLDRLLIESDGPWLLPKNLKSSVSNGLNEPRYLTHVVEKIAQIKGVSILDIEKHQRQNFDTIVGTKAIPKIVANKNIITI